MPGLVLFAVVATGLPSIFKKGCGIAAGWPLAAMLLRWWPINSDMI